MGSQDQGGCFVVIGIIMIIAGFVWWFIPLMVLGVIFLVCGINKSSKSKQKATQQATTTFTPQAAPQQPVSQPVQQAPVAPIQEQPPAIARYCPDCGAPVEGTKFCPLCGKEI
ncbi:MAG: hypothetical protein ACTSPS_17345 [Promethearchaeota archaeon]